MIIVYSVHNIRYNTIQLLYYLMPYFKVENSTHTHGNNILGAEQLCVKDMLSILYGDPVREVQTRLFVLQAKHRIYSAKMIDESHRRHNNHIHCCSGGTCNVRQCEKTLLKCMITLYTLVVAYYRVV